MLGFVEEGLEGEFDVSKEKGVLDRLKGGFCRECEIIIKE